MSVSLGLQTLWVEGHQWDGLYIWFCDLGWALVWLPGKTFWYLGVFWVGSGSTLNSQTPGCTQKEHLAHKLVRSWLSEFGLLNLRECLGSKLVQIRAID